MRITKEGLVFGPSGKQLKPFIFRGYEKVSIRINGKWKNPFVHRLVAEKFLGKSNLPINHKDCNKRNNDISNLEYVTPKQNQVHASKNLLMARGTRNGNSKLSEITVREIRRLKIDLPELTQRQIAEDFYVSESLISQVLKKKVWGWLTIIMLFIPICVKAEQHSEIVLQTISMESAGESDEGMYLVAQVIVNRARRANKTLEWAVLKPKAFSCWNSPKWAKAWLYSNYTPKTHQRALKALNRAIVETDSTAMKLTHYHTTAIMPYWANGHTPTIVVGNHAFYSNIK